MIQYIDYIIVPEQASQGVSEFQDWHADQLSVGPS